MSVKDNDGRTVGYVYLQKRLMESELWKNECSNTRVLAIQLLMEANWNKSKIPLKNDRYVKSGQVASSIRGLSKSAHLTDKAVQKGLKRLVALEFITIEHADFENEATIYTICNFNKWQTPSVVKSTTAPKVIGVVKSTTLRKKKTGMTLNEPKNEKNNTFSKVQTTKNSSSTKGKKVLKNTKEATRCNLKNVSLKDMVIANGMSEEHYQFNEEQLNCSLSKITINRTKGSSRSKNADAIKLWYNDFLTAYGLGCNTNDNIDRIRCFDVLHLTEHLNDKQIQQLISNFLIEAVKAKYYPERVYDHNMIWTSNFVKYVEENVNVYTV